MKILIAVSFALLLSVSAIRAADHNENASDQEHHHEHSAPHAGTLVVIGEEFAHLELVLDPGTGTLIAFILDGEAENAVRIGQQGIEIRIKDMVPTGDGKEPADFTMALKAVGNVLTGETAGDTSEFTAQSDRLKDVQKFDAIISAINIKGQTFRDIDFRFPEGNE
jgi:hypothetical protein